MLWFSVWAVLVVGTLVGAFFLLRDVYRSAKGLVRELERAAEVTAELAARVDELAEKAGTTPARVELLDPEPAMARMAEARRTRARRDARRSRRHAETFRRWRSFTR